MARNPKRDRRRENIEDIQEQRREEKARANAHIERQFNRVAISLHDFREASSYLTAIDATMPETVRRGLLIAAVVAYARPFLQSDTGQDAESGEARSIPAIPGKATRGLESAELALHDKIIALRSEAVAHSDFNRKATRRVPTKPKPGTRGWVTINRLFELLSELPDVDLFRSLVAKLTQYCIGRLNELNAQLEGPIPLSELFPPGEPSRE